MNTKPLSYWSGLVAIVWMVGVYRIFGQPPFPFLNALFGLEARTWLWMSVDLLVWLGIGLLFAVSGLRCGKSVGQIFGIAAIIVFIYFGWHLFHPDYVPDAA